jgi:hypothetical protein
MYACMARRCLNLDGKHPAYADIPLLVSKDEFVQWAIPQIASFMALYPHEIPSIHRVDVKLGYRIDNLAIISWDENRRLAKRSGQFKDGKSSFNQRSVNGVSKYNDWNSCHKSKKGEPTGCNSSGSFTGRIDDTIFLHRAVSSYTYAGSGEEYLAGSFDSLLTLNYAGGNAVGDRVITADNGLTYRVSSKFSSSFAAGNQYIALTSNSLYRPSVVSVSAWVKLSSTPAVYGTIFDNLSGTPWYGYVMGILPNGTIEFENNVGGTDTVITGNTVLSTGIWYHVVGMFDGSNQTVWLNGVQDAINPLVGSINYTVAVNPAIGIRSITHNSNLFLGQIDDVKVYGRALTTSEISILSAGGSVSNANLVAWYRMDEGSGTAITDGSGNSLSGTLTNGASYSTSVPALLS